MDSVPAPDPDGLPDDSPGPSANPRPSAGSGSSPSPSHRLLRPAPAARTQVLLSAALGIVVGALSLLVIPPALAILLAWDAAAAVYVVGAWLMIWRLDPAQTAARAVREDPTRTTMHLLLLTAAVASLVAVGVVLVSAARSDGSAQDTRVALGLASVVVSWSLVHTVFALRYAAEYYTGTQGGIASTRTIRRTSRTSPTSRSASA